MIRRPSVERRDAPNADNQRPCTYPIRELISFQQPLGLNHFPLAMNPFGLYGAEPRTLLGQKATHNPHPSPLCLTRRLCLPNQRLSSLEVCQLVLSQMTTSTFLPISSSLWAHHDRN